MRRPIFMLFDKIRHEQKRFNKERIILCATNDYAVPFCYIAKKNNFELDSIIPLDIPENYIKDYSGFPLVDESSDKQKYLVVVMLSLPIQNINAVIDELKNYGYTAIVQMTNDDISAVTTEISQHSYFLDEIGEMLRKGHWDKSIFLRGLNQDAMMIALTLKMKGYIINGIILDDTLLHMQNFSFKEIPLITSQVANQHKSGLIIDLLSSNNDVDYEALKKKHIFWKPSLADQLAIRIHWNFLQQFYSLLDLDIPSKNFDYETQAQKILFAYDKVTICFMDSERIGSMMETLVFINQREDKKNLYALIPRYNKYGKEVIFSSAQTANNFLLKKIKEVCPVITSDQNNFWRYFAQHHANTLEYTDDFQHYCMRMKQIEKFFKGVYYVEEPPIVFSEEEESYCRKKMRNMGIKNEYVAFFSRGHNYLKTVFGEKFINYSHTVRNSSVKNFSLMCKNLYSKGLQTVRMGYMVDGKISGNGIIDYANNFREEMLDYYLVAKSKFFVCDFSGMTIIALLFHVPLVVVNVTSLALNGDESAHKDNKNEVMMLPKKLFDTKRKRFISLIKQLKFEEEIPNIYERMNYFKNNGLEYIENTPEEIWDAAEEMLLRLEGKFNPSAEAKKLQENFQNALQESVKRHPEIIPNGDFISSKFLLKNKWLLEPTITQ